VFKRARDKHFDVKAMRIVLQRRAMEPEKRDAQDYNVAAYEHALGAKKAAIEAMEQGASAREAAKAHGLPRAAVTALKAGAENRNFEPDDSDLAWGREEAERLGLTESSGQPVRGLDGDGTAASRPLDTEIDLTIPPALRRTRAA
jgi:hypothetical protein